MDDRDVTMTEPQEELSAEAQAAALRMKVEEEHEWFDSLEYIYQNEGPGRVRDMLQKLQVWAQKRGVKTHFSANTPYINTIQPEDQPAYPGDRDIERRIKSIIRWNAMAMVVRANRSASGIGGHISTYASVATLFEVGFNHFFRAKNKNQDGDIVYYQGHACPGIYARAYLEGRLTEKDLGNFRRELSGGLSSYPHPHLMPDFWQFPTVSMGLSPIMAIYQARFQHYLIDRGIKERTDQKVWAFLGDGELDEPEALGAITLASRAHLDNLIFVVNCNLQRLDGPVRGNGKIIQELEAVFRGAGWNVIKVIWGSDWDPLLAQDTHGLLTKRMDELIDGQQQRYVISTGEYIRNDFFGKYPELLDMVKNYSDDQVRKLQRGGHDPEKVYAAYKAATIHTGAPTVILAQTIKGYGLGEAGEGRNISHQQKKLNEQELKEFRSRFGIPISDEDVSDAPFYKPAEDSPEIQYLKSRRRELGGSIPVRSESANAIRTPPNDLFSEFYKSSGDREIATTMTAVQIITKLLKNKDIGKYIVPIVPDEARTFGMEAMFRQVGIYSHVGQNYEPVDRESLLYYKEAKDGQVLEEGITEAGSMSSFIAAGTSYSTHGIQMVPFFIFYSMFGFQRIGDLIWAALDMRTRGFLFGGTSGRTTLAGEGLQHQDGHSHLLAYPYPHLSAYDPAFAYEVAVIVRDGIYRMYEKGEQVLYYLTLVNEAYPMPEMPKGVEPGILKGMYKYKASMAKGLKHKAHLMGSGAILNEVLKAQDMLESKYNVSVDVWSVTSYKELFKNATDTERYNLLHPSSAPRKSHLESILEKEQGIFVATSDYVKALPCSISKWIPTPFVTLGTDGFGRSDTRADLRDFFEVDSRYIVYGTLAGLLWKGELEADVVTQARKDLNLDPDKLNPIDC